MAATGPARGGLTNGGPGRGCCQGDGAGNGSARAGTGAGPITVPHTGRGHRRPRTPPRPPPAPTPAPATIGPYTGPGHQRPRPHTGSKHRPQTPAPASPPWAAAAPGPLTKMAGPAGRTEQTKAWARRSRTAGTWAGERLLPCGDRCGAGEGPPGSPDPSGCCRGETSAFGLLQVVGTLCFLRPHARPYHRDGAEPPPPRPQRQCEGTAQGRQYGPLNGHGHRRKVGAELGTGPPTPLCAWVRAGICPVLQARAQWVTRHLSPCRSVGNLSQRRDSSHGTPVRPIPAPVVSSLPLVSAPLP